MGVIVDALPLVILMLATGVVGGILAGLLGVGGGIVIVPVLEFALGVAGVDPGIRMHVAVATSLATIIPTSIASSRAHHARGAVDFGLVKSWGASILLGSVFGTWIASQVNSTVLAAVFAVIALLVALKMMLPLQDKVVAKNVPTGVVGIPLPFSIGTLSSMMGIGGGTLSVPILTLLSKPIHQAVGTAALFGLVISVPGTIGFVVGGWNNPSLPLGSFGFVNIIGFLIISPATVIAAPFGAKIAHMLTRRQLSIAFGLFLLIVGIRMFCRALIG
tara:strand:+ start:2321 stop:3145 length:825 start_codon:yes stop_codon:yes gene_type:complete